MGPSQQPLHPALQPYAGIIDSIESWLFVFALVGSGLAFFWLRHPNGHRTWRRDLLIAVAFLIAAAVVLGVRS